MPHPEEVLAGLAAIADRHWFVALAWRALLAGALACAWAGWRPSRRTLLRLLAAPLFSVALLAFAARNPFNGAVFAALGFGALAAGARAGGEPVALGDRPAVALGALLLGFGWIYPHFLGGGPTFAALYRAPTGVLPCPTLSVVIGVTAACDGLGPRGWRFALAAAGVFYGAFGAFRLGVRIDLVLLLGALALLAAAAVRVSAPRERGRPAHGGASLEG
jgi:hypothetical protein